MITSVRGLHPLRPSRVDFGAPESNALDLVDLEQACDPATFGRNQEHVLDESYRKAVKLDSQHFSLGFDAHQVGLVDAVCAGLLRGRTKQPVVADLYKLNVYGKRTSLLA